MQDEAFSVALVDGKLMVIAVSEGRRMVLETSTSTYSDGAWHYINTTKDGR